MKIKTAAEFVALVREKQAKLKPNTYLRFTDCEGDYQKLISAEVDGKTVKLSYTQGDPNATGVDADAEINTICGTYLYPENIRESTVTSQCIRGCDLDEEPYAISFHAFSKPKMRRNRVSIDELFMFSTVHPTHYATLSESELLKEGVDMENELARHGINIPARDLLKYIEVNYLRAFRQIKGTPQPEVMLGNGIAIYQKDFDERVAKMKEIALAQGAPEAEAETKSREFVLAGLMTI